MENYAIQFLNFFSVIELRKKWLILFSVLARTTKEKRLFLS
jgi:hypothetical protein